jgi:type II secretory pathway pseudopilin PulG
MRTHQKHPRGLTLIEAMLLLVIVSIVAVAAGVGMQAVAKVPAATDETMSINSTLVNVMEQVRGNLLRNWSSSNFNGSNYALSINGTSYTPAGTTIGTTATPGTSYSTPASGASPAPVIINNKTFVIKVAVDKADPAGSTSYKTDFLQITVTCMPVVSGAASANGQKIMVSYVTQP